jgi:amino acid transporter
MLGAGIYSAPAPAARAAGGWLPLAVLLAGAVAWCNATSTARLAAVFPESGGTYVYAGRLLGRPWGHLAGVAALGAVLALAWMPSRAPLPSENEPSHNQPVENQPVENRTHVDEWELEPTA